LIAIEALIHTGWVVLHTKYVHVYYVLVGTSMMYTYQDGQTDWWSLWSLSDFEHICNRLHY